MTGKKKFKTHLQSVKLCCSQEKQLRKHSQIIAIQAPEKTKHKLEKKQVYRPFPDIMAEVVRCPYN